LQPRLCNPGFGSFQSGLGLNDSTIQDCAVFGSEHRWSIRVPLGLHENLLSSPLRMLSDVKLIRQWIRQDSSSFAALRP
jgi:hypothetical protein